MNKDNIKAKGIVTATVCDASSLSARVYGRLINFFLKLGAKGITGRLIAAYHKKFMLRQVVQENIVPTVGRELLADAITGQLVAISDVEVNYTALGTGTTAPANGDTTLDTETFRKTIASQTSASNVSYNTAFYTAADTNGTFYEHGIFIDGTASADSGTLFSRVLLNSPSGVAKSASETLTIEHEHTFS